MDASNDELLAKNDELVREMRQMEREHEEITKELFYNNEDLTKRVNELEERNKELFERCRVLNKNRSLKEDHEKEKQKIMQEMQEMRNQHEKKESSSAGQIRYLEYRCKQFEAKNHQLQVDHSNIAALSVANSNLRSATRDLNMKMAALQVELNMLRHANPTTGDLSSQITTFKMDNEQLKLELKKTQKKLKASKLDTEYEIRRTSAIREVFMSIKEGMKAEKKCGQNDCCGNELIEYCCCNICCSDYDSVLFIPRTLRCGHTFCDVCIGKLEKYSSIKCPTCTSKYETYEKPPINYLVMSMVEAAMKIQSKSQGRPSQNVSQGSKLSTQAIQESESSMNLLTLDDNL